MTDDNELHDGVLKAIEQGRVVYVTQVRSARLEDGTWAIIAAPEDWLQIISLMVEGPPDDRLSAGKMLARAVGKTLILNAPPVPPKPVVPWWQFWKA